MSTNQKRLSNAISNINMNSYRAFKNLINEGKLNSLVNMNKTNKLLIERNLENNINNNQNQKNSTKHIFSSQSQRFEWQTNPAKNNYSDVNFFSNGAETINYNNFYSNKSNKNETNNWNGMDYIRNDDYRRSIYNGDNLKRSQKNINSRDNILEMKINRKNCENFLLEDYPICKIYTKDEKKKFVRSSSMQDIFDKTENNTKPYNKFIHLKLPESKIFTNKPPTPKNKGVRRMSIGKIDSKNFESEKTINNNVEEIKFYNTNCKNNHLRNYMNSNTKLLMNKNGIKDKPSSDKSNISWKPSKASTNHLSQSSKYKMN